MLNNLGSFSVFNMVVSGQLKPTTTATALPSNVSRIIEIRALSTNTGNVYLGPSGVSSTTGHVLAPGTGITLFLDDPSRVFAIATNGTDTVSFLIQA